MTICSVCFWKPGAYKTPTGRTESVAYETPTNIEPQSQCEMCGKKCLGYLVIPRTANQPSGELDKEVQSLHMHA